MNRISSRTTLDKKLDEEFPSLSSLPKRPQTPSLKETQSGPSSLNNPPASPQAQPAPPTVSPAEQFASFDIKSPENLLTTDLTQKDFGHALQASLEMIPDTPYDIPEPPPDSAADLPPGYPQYPKMKLLQPDFFKKFDLSTLFFIFFYQPGTPQQYFAGQELKRRDWRFHTRYQTWFHRLSEPTEKTVSYEIGKFEYFDHGTPEEWCMRQRNPFKFEYEHLGE